MSRLVLTFCLAALTALFSTDATVAFAQARKKPATKKPAPKKAPPKPKINLPMEARRTKIEIAPVSASQRARAQRSAAVIDGIIERGLKKLSLIHI